MTPKCTDAHTHAHTHTHKTLNFNSRLQLTDILNCGKFKNKNNFNC